jgi:hypothetical protein
MQYLESNKGNIYLIDDIDKELLNYNWYETEDRYLYRNIDNKSEYLHIEILKRIGIYIEGFQGDHRDRDVTNNCRENLRLATKIQNSQNIGKRKCNGDISSIYKGVIYLKNRNKWMASIRVNGIRFYRCFKTEIEAAKWYNEQAKWYFGEFAVLNKIDE